MSVEPLPRNAEAVIWVMLGTGVFSVVYASGKFAGDVASPLQVMLFRYVGGFIVLLCIAISGGNSIALHLSKSPLSHFIRAVLGCYGGVAIVYASANMPIVDATAISLLYVVFVIPLGLFFFSERITAAHGAAIVVSSAGAALVMGAKGAFGKPDVSYLLPASVALAGAMLLAFEGIMIRMLSQADKALTVLLYINCFGILLLLVPALLTWKSDRILDNLPFLLIGPVAIAGQYCIIRGMAYPVSNG